MKKPIPVREYSRPTFRPRLEPLETRLTPTTYTVSSLADSGPGSLRAAITSVNGDSTADVIDFSVAGVIQLASALPAITNRVMIDGTTAPGFTNAPIVEIDNNGFAGLTLSGISSSLISLSIVNATGPGVTLANTGITLEGNYIGLALDGSVAGNTGEGVFESNTTGVLIGGNVPADRNVISGNSGNGIEIGTGTGAEGVLIEGNFIGTDPTGQTAAPNLGNGISLTGGQFNYVGGTAAQGYVGNTIAFNDKFGVVIDGSQATQILSNSIFSNGSGGIDLLNGGNANIAAPQLSYAVESPGPVAGQSQVQIGGVLNLASGSDLFGIQNVAIQVFATLNGVPTGQGQLLLGSVNVTTNHSGFAAFTLRNLPVPVGSTSFTATATIPAENQEGTKSGSTSVFSNSIGMSTANQAYVANVYQLLLSRVPDPSASVWVNDLNNGASPASLVLAIEASTEYLNDQVNSMYNLYLQRPADPGGAQYWVSFLQAGGTFEEVAASIAASQEYFVLEGGTNQGFITGLYQDVLNRSASTAEIAGWETALANGASRFDVSFAFLTSQEYRTDLVQADYMTFILRPADQGGLATWANALNAGATDQEVLAGIFGSSEGYQLWS